MDNEINEFLEKSVDKYVPFKKVLKSHGLTYQEGLRKSKEYYWKFRSLLKTFNIDTTSKENIYLSICELAEKSPNDDLLKLYCMVLTDNGLLMDNKNPMRTDEQNILSWLEQSKKFRKVHRYIKNQSTLENRLQKVIKSLDSLKIVEKKLSSEHDDVVKIVLPCNIYYKCKNRDILLNNIENLIKMLRSNDDLREISAYVCFAILTRKQSYMSSHDGYSPNLKAIFKYEKYQIDTDNGKNFKNYLEYLQIYVRLCEYYFKHYIIDSSLSDYCFLKYSNLSEWYYSNDDVHNLGVPVPFLDIIRKYLDGNISIDFPKYELVENSVADKMLLNTIYNYPDMLEKFISARASNQDTSNIVREFYNLSKVEEKYPNNEDLAEVILIGETSSYIEKIFIETAKNFIKSKDVP
ncbi:MAG: hypothetical protein ACI4WH_05210 [Oscillospiraceae bacterium]